MEPKITKLEKIEDFNRLKSGEAVNVRLRKAYDPVDGAYFEAYEGPALYVWQSITTNIPGFENSINYGFLTRGDIPHSIKIKAFEPSQGNFSLDDYGYLVESENAKVSFIITSTHENPGIPNQDLALCVMNSRGL